MTATEPTSLETIPNQRISVNQALLAATRLALPTYRGVQRVWSGSRTVGAASVVSNPNGEILLVRVSYRRGWGLPGGFCKRGETPSDTARRELLEETGLECDFSTQVARAGLDRFHAHVNFMFTGSADGTPRRPTSFFGRLEIREVGWFALDDLPDLQHGARELMALAALT